MRSGYGQAGQGGASHLWRSPDVEDTKRMAVLLAPFLQVGDCIELSGDLGAGKTQFVQGLASGLAVTAQVVSPTFNILLTYPEGRVPLFHFDLYRLDDPLELEDIGFYDVLDDEGVVCIEWGDRFPEALPDDRLTVILRRADAAGEAAAMAAGEVAETAGALEAGRASMQAAADERLVELAAHGPRAQELRDAWETALSQETESGFSHV